MAKEKWVSKVLIWRARPEGKEGVGMAKEPWVLHSRYKGCVIEWRPNHLRRGYASIYHNWYHDGRIGTFVHHSLRNARAHIDKLHKDLGDRIAVSEAEYRAYVE